MSEKIQPVLRAVEEFDTYLDPYNTTTVARAYSYFRSPGKVSYVHSVKETGLNKHSGARWYNWRNTGVSSVRTNAQGRFITYKRDGKWRSAGLDYWSLQRNADWCRLFEETFGLPFSFSTIHPLAPHYDLIDERALATGFSGSLKEADLKAQVASLFGKTRTRRDLMRAVAGSYPNAIMLAREFRGLVPIDWLVDFLRNNPRNLQANTHVPLGVGMRRHLVSIDPRSYRSLLRDTRVLNNASWSEIRDLTDQPWARRLNRVPVAEGRFRSFTEMHDAYFAQRRETYRSEPRVNQPIPPTKIYNALHGVDVAGHRIVMPEDTDQIMTWGEMMSNCIGGYAYSVTSDKRTRELGGIYDRDNRLIANFEITNKSLSQLLGRFNRPLNESIRAAVVSEFKSRGIVIPNDYWGAENIA